MNSNPTNNGSRLGPIVNEILCWTQNMMNILPLEMIVKLSKMKFEKENTYIACELLLSHVVKDSVTPTHRRRVIKLPTDTKLSYSMKEIWQIFQENADIPRFVAQDLYKLPPIAIDNCDVSDILLSLKNLEIKAIASYECAKSSLTSIEHVLSNETDILNRL